MGHALSSAHRLQALRKSTLQQFRFSYLLSFLPLPPLFLSGVSMCVAYRQTCVGCTHGGQSLASPVFPDGFPTCVLRQNLSVNLELTDWSRLAKELQ